MSFDRKIEGDTVKISTSKDFMLSTEVFVTNCDDARRILLSRKIRKTTSAENKDGKIYITSHYCTCPLCGKRLSAYDNSYFAKNHFLNNRIYELCDNQLSFFPEKKINSIQFNQTKKVGKSVRCPHCGFSSIISDKMISCMITVNQNKLNISYALKNVIDVMAISWLPKETMAFDDGCNETLIFDLQNGTVKASLNCENKELCSIPVISSKTLAEKDPLMLMFANKRIFREIKRAFEKIYGVLPFSDRKLTFDDLILLTKFVGYKAEFYRELPLSIDDDLTILSEEFESNSNRLHYSDSIPSVFSEMNIPKAKSINRIIFNRPSLLLYEKELERLWRIIDNIDLFCELLTCKSVFAILAYFHLYIGIDEYLIDVRKVMGAVWLQRMLASNCCYSFCSLGIKYISSNAAARRRLLKNTLKNYEYKANTYYEEPFYFSVPMPICTENSLKNVVYDFQFVFLSTLKEYYIAGKELRNCLERYFFNKNSQVYIVRKSNKTLAAIEISENRIVQAYCKKNTPIKSKQMRNAITTWAKNNSFSIDDAFFGT